VKFLLNFLYNPNNKTLSQEGSNAEVGQVITGTKFASFLTPDMASGYPSTNLTNAMSGIVF